MYKCFIFHIFVSLSLFRPFTFHAIMMQYPEAIRMMTPIFIIIAWSMTIGHDDHHFHNHNLSAVSSINGLSCFVSPPSLHGFGRPWKSGNLGTMMDVMMTKLFKTIINVVMTKLLKTIINVVIKKFFITEVMTKLFTTSKAVIREHFGLGKIMVRLTMMTKTMTAMDNMGTEEDNVSID